MRVQTENSTPLYDPPTPITTRRKFLHAASLGLGFAGLIRTPDVFSMAQDEADAVHQTVSAS